MSSLRSIKAPVPSGILSLSPPRNRNNNNNNNNNNRRRKGKIKILQKDLAPPSPFRAPLANGGFLVSTVVLEFHNLPKNPKRATLVSKCGQKIGPEAEMEKWLQENVGGFADDDWEVGEHKVSKRFQVQVTPYLARRFKEFALQCANGQATPITYSRKIIKIVCKNISVVFMILRFFT